MYEWKRKKKKGGKKGEKFSHLPSRQLHSHWKGMHASPDSRTNMPPPIVVLPFALDGHPSSFFFFLFFVMVIIVCRDVCGEWMRYLSLVVHFQFLTLSSLLMLLCCSFFFFFLCGRDLMNDYVFFIFY